jgi:hypothetical protein
VGCGGCGKGSGSGIDKQVICVMDGGAGMDGGKLMQDEGCSYFTVP